LAEKKTIKNKKQSHIPDLAKYLTQLQTLVILSKLQPNLTSYV